MFKLARKSLSCCLLPRNGSRALTPAERSHGTNPLLLNSRRLASNAAGLPEHIAVLGAGISGLTAAFHLGRRFPNTRITVLESQPRAGGWIQTESVDLGPQYGKVVLEGGPRTLRPISRPLLELVNLLDLQSQLIITPKSAPAATNRFIYLSKPDGTGLKALPSSPLNLFVSPFFFTLASSVITERYWPPNRPAPLPVPEQDKAELSTQMKVYDDESVDAFLTRRFGTKVARLFGSALVHGVYATDSRRLSVRSSFPSLWEAEDRGKGSVVTGILRKKEPSGTPEVFETGDMTNILTDASVFSFKDGINQLPLSLIERLSTMPSVEMRVSCGVSSIQPQQESILIKLQDGTTINPSHVISCLPLPQLDSLLTGAQNLPYLKFNPSSTVTVVNLVFPCAPNELHPAGFGYLLPRPEVGYEGAATDMIGVVFDSCALSEQDSRGSAPLTKLTVMCGGPYESDSSSFSLETVLARLFEQLQRPRIEPIHVRVQRQVDCIPVPLVGHLDRMAELTRMLLEDPWYGRLRIAGAGVGGAGIADCVQTARKLALTL